jgi:hypothetical protein
MAGAFSESPWFCGHGNSGNALSVRPFGGYERIIGTIRVDSRNYEKRRGYFQTRLIRAVANRFEVYISHDFTGKMGKFIANIRTTCSAVVASS